jgi:hypothetical protein
LDAPAVVQTICNLLNCSTGGGWIQEVEKNRKVFVKYGSSARPPHKSSHVNQELRPGFAIRVQKKLYTEHHPLDYPKKGRESREKREVINSLNNGASRQSDKVGC